MGRGCLVEAGKCSRNASECPQVGFCDSEKNAVNWMQIGVNRRYIWTKRARFHTILQLGMLQCEGEPPRS